MTVRIVQKGAGRQNDLAEGVRKSLGTMSIAAQALQKQQERALLTVHQARTSLPATALAAQRIELGCSLKASLEAVAMIPPLQLKKVVLPSPTFAKRASDVVRHAMHHLTPVLRPPRIEPGVFPLSTLIQKGMDESLHALAVAAFKALHLSDAVAVISSSVLGPLRLMERQLPLLAADSAFHAAMEGDREDVAGFIVTFLGQKPTPATELALLEPDWREVPPEKVIEFLRRRVVLLMQGSTPIWKSKPGGRRIDLLERPITGDGSLTLADTLESGPDPIERAIDLISASSSIVSFARRLTQRELQILLRVPVEGGWSQAARAVGLPSERGDYLRKKMRRWVESGVITPPAA